MDDHNRGALAVYLGEVNRFRLLLLKNASNLWSGGSIFDRGVETLVVRRNLHQHAHCISPLLKIADLDSQPIGKANLDTKNRELGPERCTVRRGRSFAPADHQ